MEKLGKLIRLARENTRDEVRGKSLTQEELAHRVHKSKQWINQIESGHSLPTPEFLVEIYEALNATRPQGLDIPLSVWLLQWLEERIEQKNGQDVRQDTLRASIDEAILRLSQTTTARTEDCRCSLEHFPHAFEPLTIIGGDRREPRPKSRGDIFAYSVSITDFTFLINLGLDRGTRIRSDKLFVWMDEDDLRAEFGQTHLMVIGSPAVNFAARSINNSSVFRFDLAPEVKEWERQMKDLKELNDPWLVENFWSMVQKPDASDANVPRNKEMSEEQTRALEKVAQGLGRRSVKDIMNSFRNPGLIDPADRRTHARNTRLDNDFAVISLGPNPFADSSKYACIFVAGIHGPGTAHAVRALGEDDFKDHPFGGVIEVELNLFKDWSTRFQQARWEWQTRKYKPEELLKNLQCELQQSAEDIEEGKESELKKCVMFLQSVLTDRHLDTF